LTQVPPDDDPSPRAVSLISQGLIELYRLANQASIGEARNEIAGVRASVESLAARMERQIAEDSDQRRRLGGQLAALAGSLDRLVAHLQALSTQMTELLVRLDTQARPATEPAAPEASFLPVEGITVAFADVGFQSLRDIEQAFSALPTVARAVITRYVENDQRVELDLRAPVTASDLVQAIRNSTGLDAAVDEARLERHRLEVKILP
jgi:hypothetical protein